MLHILSICLEDQRYSSACSCQSSWISPRTFSYPGNSLEVLGDNSQPVRCDSVSMPSVLDLLWDNSDICPTQWFHRSPMGWHPTSTQWPLSTSTLSFCSRFALGSSPPWTCSQTHAPKAPETFPPWLAMPKIVLHSYYLFHLIFLFLELFFKFNFVLYLYRIVHDFKV